MTVPVFAWISFVSDSRGAEGKEIPSVIAVRISVFMESSSFFQPEFFFACSDLSKLSFYIFTWDLADFARDFWNSEFSICVAEALVAINANDCRIVEIVGSSDCFCVNACTFSAMSFANSICVSDFSFRSSLSLSSSSVSSDDDFVSCSCVPSVVLF